MELSPSDPEIQTLLERIRRGDLDLQPDFQRGEVWTSRKKRRLIDSILRNWYIPPVHTILVPETHKQDVLDGQQRLAAIRDFSEDEFPVDGTIQPNSELLSRLHGLTYSQLPLEIQRVFNSFTIRVIRISNYEPEEPGELFYRLNQITSITAAEQRNAFYGPVRQQVKALVEHFKIRGSAQEIVGFSNARMAYDDVISKLLIAIETRDLATQMTANFISDRFRSEQPFADNVYEIAKLSIENFADNLAHLPSLKFNKATLLSWLIVFATYAGYGKSDLLTRTQESIVDMFERGRHRFRTESHRFSSGTGYENYRRWLELFALYADRSTSRVQDITSVIYRDLIIHLFVGFNLKIEARDLPLSREREMVFENLQRRLFHASEEIPAEQVIEEVMPTSAWARL